MAVQFQFDFDRALAAMVYIASVQVPGLDTYKMCKLIFLSDKLHTVRFGRPITGDALCAMEYGPVPSEVYDVLNGFMAGAENARTLALSEHLTVDRQYENPRFAMKSPVDFGYYLSGSEMNALDEMVTAHGAKTFGELYSLTHEMAAYKQAWESRGFSNNPLMSYEDLFINDSEAIAGAKEEMLENYEMRQALHAH